MASRVSRASMWMGDGKPESSELFDGKAMGYGARRENLCFGGGLTCLYSGRVGRRRRRRETWKERVWTYVSGLRGDLI